MAGTGDKLIAELTDLKRKIEDARERKAKAEGRLEQQLTQLREVHGCNTTAEADKLLTKLREEEKALLIEIEEGLDKLKEDYEL